MRAWRFFSALFFFISCLSFLSKEMVYSASEAELKEGITKKKEELKQIDKKIGLKEGELKRTVNLQNKTAQELKKIEKDIKNTKVTLETLSQKLKKIGEKEKGVRLRIETLDMNLKTERNRAKEILVGLYKFYRVKETDYPLFQGQLLEKQMLEIYGLNLLDEKERNITGIRRDFSQTQDLYQKVKKEKKDTGIKKEETLTIVKKISSEKEKTADELKYYENKRVASLKEIKEMEKQKVGLQALIDKLEREIVVRYPPSQFEKKKGSLNLPAMGKVISSFGRRENPETHSLSFQNGIEIETKEGAEVKSLHEGLVIFSGPFKGYGNMVIIDHGDNYISLYARVTQLLKKVKDRVKKGEIVALMGSSDHNTGPILYFEIRHKGKPQDPLKWLSSLRQ